MRQTMSCGSVQVPAFQVMIGGCAAQSRTSFRGNADPFPATEPAALASINKMSINHSPLAYSLHMKVFVFLMFLGCLEVVRGDCVYDVVSPVTFS